MSGKAQIIGAILKLDRPFKGATIVQMTGLSRQLVFNHMKRMVEEGHLEKIDKSYVTRNKEELLNSLIEQSERIETSLPQPGGILTPEMSTYFNLLAEMTIAGRTLGLPMATEHKDYMVQKCDDTIKVMKQLRKYVTSATKTEGSARRWFRKNVEPDQIDIVWKQFAKASSQAPDLEEFEKAYKEAMVEDE